MATNKKPSAITSWGQFPLRIELLTQAAITGLTANHNITQDPKIIAKTAVQIALETCNQLDTIIKTLTPSNKPDESDEGPSDPTPFKPMRITK